MEHEQQRIVLTLGALYGSWKEARETIEDFTLYKYKKVKQDTCRGGGKTKRYVCSSSGCPFYVQLCKQRRTEVWTISSMNLERLNCTSIAKPTKRQYMAFNAFREGPASVERDSESIFRRAVLSLAYLQWPHKNQFILALLLVRRDVNFSNVVTAVALVDGETKANYNCFFCHCIKAGVKIDVPIMGDRAEALLTSAEEFGLSMVHCAVHIERNCNEKFRAFMKIHGGLMWQLQGSEAEVAYHNTLAIIGNLPGGNDVRSYLAKIDPVTWVLFPNLFCRPLYGWRSSNFIESEMAATKRLGIREVHPLAYMAASAERAMEQLYKRSQLAATWASRGFTVTPEAEKRFREEAGLAGGMRTMPSSEHKVYVENLNGTRVKRRVDLVARMCTCIEMLQTKIPCRHYCAALASLGRMDEVYSAFGDEYLVETFAAAYHGQSIELPIDSEVHPDGITLPCPIPKRRGPGPTPKARFASAGEVVTKDTRVYRHGRAKKKSKHFIV
ncbi:hypothetical protein ACHHYP_20194 [Achlya hypogyna]|uniref:SWIM-type domain-containing protein n=1 Tax=Achlya hypogyna TaxID=1202772 RepID=A0A1V9YZA3_ACHHY|nr:hypothetical protein ACHHYP_20194 [Achlya hypogyna]